MNKVITDGLELMPPPFSDGLDVWSSGDGTPGSDTYAGSGNGAFVPADQDFAGALEVLKSSSVTQLRYMGETTILPGCYLRVKARVKCVSGSLPDVRIAGWPGQAGGSELTGVTTTGPSVSLTSYGEVVEVSAIIGTGQRNGVDMVWADASYGHIGLDLTGANGGIVRIDDIEIEDITNAFLRDMLGIVDVRDYGAIGDGVTDDSAAFEAADDDADGREVLITAGTYFLGDNVTFQNQVRFEGTVVMGEEHQLIFQKNFDFPTYVDAFGDEEVAFKRRFRRCSTSRIMNRLIWAAAGFPCRPLSICRPLSATARRLKPAARSAMASFSLPLDQTGTTMWSPPKAPMTPTIPIT